MPKPLVFLILALPLVGAYAMYAIGITVIYQASRVLNLAHGAMATVPAYLVYTMVVDWHVPMPVAVVVGIASGCGLGLLVEWVFVRRLRSISPTAQTVGTVAAFGLMISLTAKIWGTTGLRAPALFPGGHVKVGASNLRYGQIGLVCVSVAAALLLNLLFRRTWIGLAMRGAAQNRRGAAYVGIDPDRTAQAAWALGGGLAAAAGVMLAAVTILHPYSLSQSVLPAFVAALIGGMENLPAVLAGSAIVGVVIGFVPVIADLPVLRVVLGQVGGAELALAVTALIVMALRGQRLVATDVRGEVQRAAPVARIRKRRRVGPRLILVLLVGWIWLPWLPFSLMFSLVGDANQALLFTIVAASLVLLTGWVGQISLAQAAFVGIGAFSSVLITKHLHLPFPFSLPVAAAVAAAIATVFGLVALRVRGLYLAVATLIFGWMADSYLFSAPWFAGSGGSATLVVKPIGREGGYPFFDFSERRIFYLVALAGAGIVLVGLSNLRRSKTGRAFFAIRGSEVAAASLGIDVTRYKLLAFALSGFIAGLAGNLLATGQQTILPGQFAFTVSLLYLSIAVVGGMESLGGVVASAVVFAGLNEVFFRVDALHGWLDVVSAALLASVLLFYPGGLAALPDGLARLGIGSRFAVLAPVGRRLSRPLQRHPEWVQAARARMVRAGIRGPGTDDLWARLFPLFGLAPPEPAARVSPRGPDREGRPAAIEPSPVHRTPPVRRLERRPVLSAAGVTVRFGGLTAVDDVSLEVREGEVVGLIGPNGAGKTTLFNAIAGYVAPVSGSIAVRGEDVTALPMHERAARGIGRTFQVIQLFSQLTVRENLLVATHGSNPTGFVSQLVLTSRSVASERAAEGRVDEVLDLLGLGDVAGRPVAGLPFGTLRMVELARAVVTGAGIVMLDEAASGLDSRETDRFAGLLLALRERLDLSLLLIEHDIRMVMSMSDHVYVLDRGRLIADGPPSRVQANEAVVAAYLGRASVGAGT